MLSLVLLLASLNLQDIDASIVDTRMLAQTSTMSDCEIEKRIIAKERDFWKLETIQQAENALSFERRAERAERAVNQERDAHGRTRAQRDALLAAPPIRPAESDSSVNISWIPDWIAPAAIGLGAGLIIGAGAVLIGG